MGSLKNYRKAYKHQVKHWRQIVTVRPRGTPHSEFVPGDMVEVWMWHLFHFQTLHHDGTPDGGSRMFAEDATFRAIVIRVGKKDVSYGTSADLVPIIDVFDAQGCGHMRLYLFSDHTGNFTVWKITEADIPDDDKEK